MSMIRAGLKQGVFIFVVIAIVLPMVVIGGVFLSYYKQETTAEINDDNLHIAGLIRDGVSNALNAPKRTLNIVVGLAEQPEYAPHIDDLMAQLVSSYDFFESIMVLDGNGIVRHLGTASKINLHRQDYLGIDLSEAEHIATARRLKKQTWSDTYISTFTGEPTLALTIPFERGLIVGNLNFAELTRSIERHLSPSLDRIYLVNSKGRIIAHPEKSLVLQQVNVSNLTVVRAGLEGREGVYEYDVEGVEFIGAVVIIPETNWLVIVERDKGEVFRFFRSMQRAFAVALVSTLLLVVLFIVYVNSRIIKPVVAISTATASIAGGSFLPVPEYRGRFTELMDLTRNFNTMTTALHEREQDLADKNRDLEEEVERRILSEEEYRRLVQAANSVILTWDTMGTIQFINDFGERFFGFSQDELVGRNVIGTIVPEHESSGRNLALLMQEIQNAPDQFKDNENENITKDGTRVWVRWANKAIMDDQGTLVSILSVGNDMTARKRAEEALRRSQRLLNSTFTSLRDAFFLIDADTTTITECNPAAAAIFGYSVEEMVGRKTEFLHVNEETLAEFRRRLAVAVKEKGFLFLPGFLMKRKDGTVFSSEHSVMPIEEHGKLLAWVSVVRDITERKRAEETLRESEVLYRGFFSTSRDCVFIVSAEGRIIDFNDAGLEMFRYDSREELSRLSEASFYVHPERLPAVLARLEREGYIKEYPSQMKRRDGTIIDVLITAGLLRNPDGTIKARIGSIRDVTEKKRTEVERERLSADIQKMLADASRSKKEWQDTFDSITDMISIHDKDFNIIKANKAFSAFIGLSPQEVINRKCYDLMHHGAASPIAGCPHQKTLREKMPVTEEVFDETTKKTFRVTTYPYYSPSGEVIGSIHISRDITEEKERDMKMIMTERLASLGQMASGIAHEINNPLESVMICAEMLLMRVAKDSYDHAQFEKYLKIIDEEVLRCRDITGNMLSFARQSTLNKTDIDVHLLLDKAVDLVGYQGRLKNVTVTKKYGEKFLVSGNEGELRQVILVLLINALDAMENKGAITVETGTQEDSAWVRISDTGPGIAPEDLQRIFNPFYSTKTEKGGTGLGLSIAHRIIADHNGSLTVVSEQGHGAAFTVTLPR